MTDNAAARARASAQSPAPSEVTDVMLWRLAMDVIGAHQQGPDGRCGSLQCVGEPWPCPPLRWAEHALRASGVVDEPATPEKPEQEPSTGLGSAWRPPRARNSNRSAA